MTDAIERLRRWADMEPLAPFPDPADLRALLDAYDALESDYAKFRRGVRGAIGKPSNLAVSDQWIIDAVKEQEAVAQGLAEALETAVDNTSDNLWVSVDYEPAWNLRDRLSAALAAWKEWKGE